MSDDEKASGQAGGSNPRNTAIGLTGPRRTLTGWKWVGDYPVAITITVLATVRATRDIANFEKAVTDLLVNQGVIVGDSLKYVTSMLIVYRPAGVAGVKVAIEKDWQPDSPATAKLR